MDKNETDREQRKVETKELLLRKTSHLLKRRGIKKTSVDDVMRAASLTRGSFYVYFKNKKNMVLESLRWSIKESNKKIRAQVKGVEDDKKFEHFIDFYLSSLHRNKVEEGCPIAALCRDFSHESSAQQREFSFILSEMIEERRKVLLHKGRVFSREDWIGIMSSYIGALVLSRSCQEEELSEEILMASNKFLKKWGEL